MNIVFFLLGTFIHMESLLAQEVSARDGPDLIEFLLDVAPAYGRITMESDAETRQLLEEDFCQRLRGASVPTVRMPRFLSPYKCHECNGRDVCVDTSLACLVCRQCGLQGPIGFEHGYRDFSGKDAQQVFRYKPVNYMLRLLDQLQGFGIPRVPAETWQAIRCDLRNRKIPETDVSPSDVLCTLRSLRLSHLYPHRWFLTKKLNVHYVPLRVSFELEQRIRAVFQAAYEQFLRQYAWVSRRKRKFPSYFIFIQIVLQYLGVPDVDRHFTPPSNVRNRRAICKRICGLIKAI